MLALIQEELAQQEGTRDEGVTSLLYLLQSPLFTQLLKIQDSLTQLKEVKYSSSLASFQCQCTRTDAFALYRCVTRSAYL